MGHDHESVAGLRNEIATSSRRVGLTGATRDVVGARVDDGSVEWVPPVPQLIPRQRTCGRLLPRQVEQQLRRYAAQRERVLIAGEAGSGRSSAALVLAGDAPVDLLGSEDVPALGQQLWCRRLAWLLVEPRGLIVLEDVHLLPAPLAVWLAHRIDNTSAWLALTSDVPDQHGTEHAALLARFPSRVQLAPLRARRAELPTLARTMLAGMALGQSLRLTPGALQLLAEQPWPANLRELDAVLRACVRRRSVGDITARDLPDEYQTPAKAPRTPWQQAEFDAIVRALRATGGNKVHAARELGISRSTLYNRLRVLGIST